jgi:hypothetical protein
MLLLPLRPLHDEQKDECDVTETAGPTEGVGELLEEGKPIKCLRGPIRPTKLELEEHSHNHIPFRSWCPHCMRGKSKASGHRSSTHTREKPIISLDYAFLGVSKGVSREDRLKLETEAVAAGHTPTLVMFDSESRGIYAYATARKGYNELLCRQVVNDLDNLGYKDIVLKSDQEPALINLLETIKAAWNGNSVLENSPVRESEANGAVERAIQTWEGQVRTMKDALEHKLQVVIPPDHAIMTWIIEYAASLLRRCLISNDGRTPYEKIKGRPSRRQVAVFGEKVWYKPSHGRSKTLDYVLDEGIFLGVQDRSDEALIGISSGVVKCRDIRRQSDDRRWDKDLVLAISVTPSQPTEGSADMRVKTYISPGLDDPTIPLPAATLRVGQGARRVKLLRQDFERAGLTIGCNGCKAMSRRAAGAVNHSEACRARVQADMAKYPDAVARMAQAEDRLNEDVLDAAVAADTAQAVRRVSFADGDSTMDVQSHLKRGLESDSITGPRSALRQRVDAVQPAAVAPASNAASSGDPNPLALGFPASPFIDTPMAASVSAEGEQGMDQGMDIDWLTIDGDKIKAKVPLRTSTAPRSSGPTQGHETCDSERLPIQITRGNTACTTTVDFTEGAWDFSQAKHRMTASKFIEDTKPGLIIGGELQQCNLSREDAVANFDSKICHAEYLSTLYNQQINRGLYYLHIALSDSKSSAIGISKMKDLEKFPRHQQVKLNNLTISTNSDAVAQSYIAQDKQFTEALIDETSERRKHRARWSDDVDEMDARLELNQFDDDDDDRYEMTAWDDVKDVALDLRKVRKARAT